MDDVIDTKKLKNRKEIIYTRPPTHPLTHKPRDDSKNAFPFIDIIIIFPHHHFLLALGYDLPVPSWGLGPKRSSVGKQAFSWRGICDMVATTWPITFCAVKYVREKSWSKSLIRQRVGRSRCHQAKNFASLEIVL
ncbi:uncharacterized protein LOC120286582 [Eucalyptus grandis]|uniref:uncharacterized protein LOC120286582 n=1 Tax=Eucalyptus grandis TaxID=71139 RepID=UPI00192E8CD4|nr:uncharacterized protein LOC120286582 [Eucalyptus grandis]